MTAILIDGRKVSESVLASLRSRIAALQRKPGLGVIIVGDDPASHIYVRKKQEACSKIGIISRRVDLKSSATDEEVLDAIERFNSDPGIDGILLQLPLPRHMDEKKIMAKISADKDADGFHVVSLGRLLAGQRSIHPCTPKGILRLLDEYRISVAGKHAVVIGRSTIVGKPIALMLLERNATVTICHSKTTDLRHHTLQADIIIAAAGSPRLVTGEMVKKGCVVIDVGTSRVEGKLSGDVDFESVSERASYITPVPGGVGPMTVAMLLENTVELCAQHG